MPKVSSDRLFKLIKSLNKQEKRYFKLDHLPIKGKEHNYVRIFNEVDKQKEYNEGALKKKFKQEAFVKHFHIIKSRVFEAVLKSLDAYHANNTTESIIRRQLHSVEILYEKLLYEDALKIIQQIKVLAKKNNLYTALLEIYHWERKTILVHRTFTDKKVIDDFKRERFHYLAILKNLYEYESFSDLIYSLYIKRKIARNEKDLEVFKQYENHPLLNDPDYPMSSDAKYYHYSIRSLFFEATGEYHKSYFARKNLMSLIEEDDKMLQNNPYKYISSIYNFIIAAMYSNRYTEGLKAIEGLKALSGKLPDKGRKDIELMIFEFTVTPQLHYYAYTGRYEEGIALISEVLEKLDFYGDRVSEQTRIYILYNACLLCLVAKEYKKGLPILNALMNQEQHHLSIEQESMVRIFNLIYHFEFGNDSLLLHLAKSTYRFLYKSERLFKFESSILNFIKKTPAAISPKEMIPYFEKLKNELLQFHNDPFENRPFEDFDYIVWLDSKINKRSFAELLREKSDRLEKAAMKV